MNACGSCSLCCKMLDIAALEKPAQQWCPQCIPGVSCKIYDARPDACRSFDCLWLASRRGAPQNFMPDELRPDRCKGLLMLNPDQRPALACHLEPAHADAWRQGALGKFLRFTARQQAIVVKAGRRLIHLDADGAFEATPMIGRDGAPQAMRLEKTAAHRVDW